MDWLIVGGIGLLVGGFHGLGVAIVGYLVFIIAMVIIANMLN